MAGKTVDDYRRESEALDRKHDALFAELEVPTYSGRTLQAQWVKAKGGGSITGTTGWTAGASEEVTALLNVGDPYILETKGFNTISGWLIDGKWYARKSDQDLEREHLAFIESSRRRWQEYADAHREEWREREAKLPEWIAQRIRAFHDNPEFESEPMGWGYELIVCELAVMYAAIGEDILDKDAFSVIDTDEIKQFAADNGTSGTQHGFALGLAKQHLQASRA